MILITILGKMYVPTLLMLVLVSAMTYRVDSAHLGVKSYSSSNKSTYQSPDGFECYGCGPGQYVNEPCSANFTNSTCLPCKPYSFSTTHDKATKCEDCRRCGLGMIVVSECSPTANRVCGCKEGKVLTQVVGNEALCVLKTAATLANETVTEQTTSEPATNRSGCPRGSFWNSTSNRCEDRNAEHQNTTINNHPTESNIILYIVIPIIVGIIVGLILVIYCKVVKKKREREIYLNQAYKYVPADDNPLKDNAGGRGGPVDPLT